MALKDTVQKRLVEGKSAWHVGLKICSLVEMWILSVEREIEENPEKHLQTSWSSKKNVIVKNSLHTILKKPTNLNGPT